MMMLDVCPPGDSDLHTCIEALNKTTNWAKRSMEHFLNTDSIYLYNL